MGIIQKNMNSKGIDWSGLLKWSVNYHDGTAPSNFKPLSKED